MPTTVSVAAFVFGLLLLVAALIGNGLRIERIELPALTSWRRVVIGVLGLGLTLFGMFDGQLPRIGGLLRVGADGGSAPGAAVVASSETGVLSCLSEVAEGDLIRLTVDEARRTDRSWSNGQPRSGVLAIQFEDPSGIRGGVKIASLASGAGFDIIAVFDAACQPVTTYRNVSRPDQPKDAPYSYDTMRYEIGNLIYAVDIAYGEGNDRLYLRAQQLVP